MFEPIIGEKYYCNMPCNYPDNFVFKLLFKVNKIDNSMVHISVIKSNYFEYIEGRESVLFLNGHILENSELSLKSKIDRILNEL
jgi:hypothetical protein